MRAFEGRVALDAGGPVRLGLLALATDLTFERDAARVIPHDRAALHVTRVRFANPTTPENLRAMAPFLADAASLLVPGAPLAAICYGCTSASVVIGDAAVGAAIGRGRPGVPVVTPVRAAVEAAAALKVRRIALMSPYLAETTGPMLRYLEAAGLEVVRVVGLGLADDGDIARVAPETMLDAAREADTGAAEALFLPCTSLPALPLVERIEARLGKPALTSNGVSLWSMLRLAGLPMPRGFGRLFDAPQEVTA